jgi:hypothetical protein
MKGIKRRLIKKLCRGVRCSAIDAERMRAPSRIPRRLHQNPGSHFQKQAKDQAFPSLSGSLQRELRWNMDAICCRWASI